jgi:hypothetical protein
MTYDEQFYNLYSLARLTGPRKSTRATWAGHVGSMEEIRNVYRIFITYLKSTNHVEDLDWRIILKQIYNKHGSRVKTALIWLMTGICGLINLKHADSFNTKLPQ